MSRPAAERHTELSGPPASHPSRPLVLGLAGALLLGGLASTGCGDDLNASQTQVIVTTSTVAGSQEATPTLTPLERGKVRREVLAAAQAGLDAWMQNDLAAIETYFSPDQAAYFRSLHDKYGEENRVRVREHSATSMDVTALDDFGTEATVEYMFTDDSYFTDPQGQKLTEPTHKQTVIQFTLAKGDDGNWTIIRIFAAAENIS